MNNKWRNRRTRGRQYEVEPCSSPPEQEGQEGTRRRALYRGEAQKGKGVLGERDSRQRRDGARRERARGRARSERKDVNPFLVSLRPIPPFLLIAGVLLSAGELPPPFLSSLQSLFPPRDPLSPFRTRASPRLCSLPLAVHRVPSVPPASLSLPLPSPPLSPSAVLSPPVRFLALPSRRGENKNYESARHSSRATARSRGFARPCLRASHDSLPPNSRDNV